MFDPTFGSSSPFWASFLDDDGFALPPVPEAIVETNEAINDTSESNPTLDDANQPGMSPDAPAFYPMKLKAANRANMQQANAASRAANTSNTSSNSTTNSSSTDNQPHRMSFEQFPNINLSAATVAQPQQSPRGSDHSSTNMYQFFEVPESSSSSEATSTETDFESVMPKSFQGRLNFSDQNKSEPADTESESTSERKRSSEQDSSYERERARYRRRERQRERAHERELDRDMIRSISSEFLQGLRRTNITCQLSFDVQTTPRTFEKTEKSKAQATQTDLNDGWGEGPPIEDFAEHINAQVSAEYLGTLRNLIIRCDDLLQPLFAGKFAKISPIQMAKYTSAILNTKPLHPSIFLPNNAARPWRSQCGLHPHCNTITKALADSGTQTDDNFFSFSPLQPLPEHNLGGTLYVPDPKAKPNRFGAIGSGRPSCAASASTNVPPPTPTPTPPPPTPPPPPPTAPPPTAPPQTAPPPTEPPPTEPPPTEPPPTEPPPTEPPPTEPPPTEPPPPKPPMVQRVQYHIMPSPKQLLYVCGYKWQIGDYPEHFSEQNFPDNGNPSNNCGYNLLSILNKNLPPGSKLPPGFRSNQQTAASNLTQANLDLIAEQEQAESAQSDDETSSTSSVITVISAKQYASKSTTPQPTNPNVAPDDSISTGSSSNTETYCSFQRNNFKDQSTPFTSYFTCNPPHLFLNPPTTYMDNAAAGDAGANSNDSYANVSSSTSESLENLETDQLDGANVVMHDNNQNMVLTKTRTFPDLTDNGPPKNVYMTQTLQDFTNTINSMPGTVDLDCPEPPPSIITESLWVHPPGSLPSLPIALHFTNFTPTCETEDTSSDEF